MNPQELSIELPAQGARRATGEGSKNGWQKPQRFSARQKTAVVLRLLRGEPLDLLSRELGIPAAALDINSFTPVRRLADRVGTIEVLQYQRSVSRECRVCFASTPHTC